MCIRDRVKSIRSGAVVEVTAPLPAVAPTGNAPLVAGNLRVISVDSDGRQTFIDSTGAPVPVAAGAQVSLVELRVTVYGPDGRIDVYDQLGTHRDQRRDIGRCV